jgi:protein-L-isoaspartate(D-aspartate) O-methyltransferase
MSKGPMIEHLDLARKCFAESICLAAGVDNPGIVAAFAKVPREKFVGPGPWRVLGGGAGYRTTEDADPKTVYHDVLIALDEAAGINNGQPCLYAALFDELKVSPGEAALHIGAGTGYYSAILAELVGPAGKVKAVEIDPALAARARVALTPWPRVEVVVGDGANLFFEPVDVILASAGFNHPPAAWLDALKPGGRLLFPMTTRRAAGRMLLVTRAGATAFRAVFSTPVAFIEAVGRRDPDLEARLEDAFARDAGVSVNSLRRDPHGEDGNCWLHGDGWCLSKLQPA